MGVTGVVGAVLDECIDFSGVCGSCDDDVLLAGEPFGGRVEFDDVVKLSGPAELFGITDDSGTPDMPL